jgi:hypothetical protein
MKRESSVLFCAQTNNGIANNAVNTFLMLKNLGRENN